MNRVTKLGPISLSAALLYAAQTSFPQQAAGAFEHGPHHGYVLDGRYNHGHYYPAVGFSVHELPLGYHPYFFGGHPYYLSAGVWYAPVATGFMVVRPPVGVVISVLPPAYTTVWIGGAPYYYANNVYYTWDSGKNGYVVVDPPVNADSPSAPPTAPDDLIIYPKNGQDAGQQAADKYDCHGWAKTQTGFDPTLAGGGVAPGTVAQTRASYDRAMSACLTARGYEVR